MECSILGINIINIIHIQGPLCRPNEIRIEISCEIRSKLATVHSPNTVLYYSISRNSRLCQGECVFSVCSVCDEFHAVNVRSHFTNATVMVHLMSRATANDTLCSCHRSCMLDPSDGQAKVTVGHFPVMMTCYANV
jgi:hypothetical protein